MQLVLNQPPSKVEPFWLAVHQKGMEEIGMLRIGEHHDNFTYRCNSLSALFINYYFMTNSAGGQTQARSKLSGWPTAVSINQSVHTEHNNVRCTDVQILSLTCVPTPGMRAQPRGIISSRKQTRLTDWVSQNNVKQKHPRTCNLSRLSLTPGHDIFAMTSVLLRRDLCNKDRDPPKPGGQRDEKGCEES